VEILNTNAALFLYIQNGRIAAVLDITRLITKKPKHTGGSTLGQGARAPRFTCYPQIQKLADRSEVISEVSECTKIQIFRSSAPDPAGPGSLQRSHTSSLMGRGLAAPFQGLHPRSRPFGPRFYRSHGLTLNPLQSWQPY